MNCDIKNYLIILILFLLVDLPMLLLVNTDMYMAQFQRINNGPMNIGENTLIGALISYILLATGLYFLIIKFPFSEEINNMNIICPKTNAIRGAIYGLIMYGMYNYTNLATINEYGSYEALVDTIWGSALCASVAYLYTVISKTKNFKDL